MSRLLELVGQSLAKLLGKSTGRVLVRVVVRC